MAYVFAVLFIVLLVAVFVLHIFSLPANWVIAGLAALWTLTHPSGEMTWAFVLVLLGLALVGEAAEFLAQTWGARKYGASGRGNLGGLIGAIAGAILAAPFLLGIGALLGALAGAFAGCFAFERLQGKSIHDSRHAATGAFWGKMFGMSAKMGLGAAMVVMCVPRVWP